MLPLSRCILLTNVADCIKELMAGLLLEAVLGLEPHRQRLLFELEGWCAADDGCISKAYKRRYS